jgi:hypothetical protein
MAAGHDDPSMEVVIAMLIVDEIDLAARGRWDGDGPAAVAAVVGSKWTP